MGWSLNCRCRRLKEQTGRYGFSVAAGDLQFLDGRWYVTHAGLLRVSECRRCSGIRSVIERGLSDPATGHWVFKATVYTSPGSKGWWWARGCRSLERVSPGPRSRNACRRDKGGQSRSPQGLWYRPVLGRRARILLCTQYGLTSQASRACFWQRKWFGHGQARLRDQLCILIRQFNLDPTLVKAYAADFCGTASLEEASRDLVDSFISQLAKGGKRGS